ncbi:flavodoxin family protein [Adlercreutzia sp. ZJ138]|uniref:flavodoxin family protein n=1 Tax=Adlercreutzia sp. ZJ138 TaxID=2709405 RepID=UPI0013EBBB32|nr:NAD(P)H-dependent oxidoreductase [Adlercreutzia sp. ZJ138]
MTNRLIIVGSPRVNGRSAALADLLFESCIEEHPDEEVALVPVSTLDIAGCIGCACCMPMRCGVRDESSGADGDDGKNGGHAGGADVGDVNDADETAAPEACARCDADSVADNDADSTPACVIGDDMQEVYPLIDAADELVVVSPVYFAGAPSQLKALLDRLQPYFWTNARKGVKRPATLHVVGEGGDPHGFDALITVVKSALAVAGFRLDTVLDWVGRIDDAGEIVEEAVVYDVSPRRPQAHTGNIIALGESNAGQADAQKSSQKDAQKGAQKSSQKDVRKDVQKDASKKRTGGKPHLDLGLNGAKPGVAAEHDKRKKPGQGQGGRTNKPSRGKGGQGSARAAGRNGKRRG